MITKKRWNELSMEKRSQIVDIVFRDVAPEFRQEYAEEWHHVVDDDHKKLFSSIFENATDGLYVRVLIN